MTIPTHTLVGLIIGNLSGAYVPALAGSLLIDIDHFFSYARHGVLFNPKKILAASMTEHDPWEDQRNIFHSLFTWGLASLVLVSLAGIWGVVFSIAYFFHLVLDMVDGATYYPFFPMRTVMIKGIIPYNSKRELYLNLVLLLLFIILLVVDTGALS